MKRPTEPTTIDDILHPGERQRAELATLDARMNRINELLHALSALDGSASPAATGFPPHGHGHLERADSPAAPGLQAPITVAPASYEQLAPFTVGDKGGYLSWRAAVQAGKERDLPVIDARGVCIWAPRAMR